MRGSLKEQLLRQGEAAVLRVIADIGAAGWEALQFDWDFVGRAEQHAPAGDWRVWLVMAGRGFGKTRAGAEWVRRVAREDGGARIALVGASLHEARSVMVEGESGLLSIAPPWERPIWSPSLRRLVWPNGAQAIVYGAADPESLRGPQHSHGWADEIAKWPQGEAAWDNLMMGMRLGVAPKLVATTTPRPVALVRRLLAEAAPAGQGADIEGGAPVLLSRGRTMDNAANLPGVFLDAMERAYGGTRTGRQELEGEYLEEIEGALWSRALFERCRARPMAAAGLSACVRVVIGVDPPAGRNGDACGIIVAGLGRDARGYVLADASVSGLGPEGWARAVARAADAWGADRVIAEANNGGAMVESVLRAAEAALPVRLVHASRGKAARAEPVAALYEAGRVSHAGAFAALEDELCGLVRGGGYEGPGRSPDRADALVWALHELMLGRNGTARVRVI